jgi:hypothetical protein
LFEVQREQEFPSQTSPLEDGGEIPFSERKLGIRELRECNNEQTHRIAPEVQEGWIGS